MADFTLFGNIIHGELRYSGKPHASINPSTKETLWTVPQASAPELDEAVNSARTAFSKWSYTDWKDRAALLRQARDILLAHESEMAKLLSIEGGKPIQFAHLEVQDAANFLDFNAKQTAPETRLIQDDDQLKLSITPKPLGVVAAICPWNYPLVLAVAKVAAALVTGNCVIVKPSPFSPYSALKFVELIRDIFPAGVVQALNGDDMLGPGLCAHPGIDKISFTGSSATGKKVMATASSTLKRVTLELAGNSASIICPDVDPAIVAPQVAVGSFFNSGQLCMASKRVYVHEDIYDAFLEAMVSAVKSWKVGPTSTLEEGIMLGPVQNQMQYEIVKGFFTDCASNGYRFAVGGEFDNNLGGFVVSPTIVDNPPDDSLVVVGEAFGPIVPIMKWKDEEEVLRRANDTSTGLGGAVWSADLSRAAAMADRIEAGTVWINHYERPLPQAHLAGWKESGIGGEWGAEGLLAYCRPQVVHQYKAPVA